MTFKICTKYDNGLNFRGNHNEYQKIVCFISSHGLHLVVKNAANISQETIRILSYGSRHWCLFSSSTIKFSFIYKHLSNLKLRPLCATRLFIRINAIKPLRYHRDKIFYLF